LALSTIFLWRGVRGRINAPTRTVPTRSAS
jgi:hypothetical protein